jgi:hypothetical protein
MENNEELQDEQDLTHDTNIQTLELCEKCEDVLLAN